MAPWKPPAGRLLQFLTDNGGACRRDYVARMDLSDAHTMLLQLRGAFEHFNEVHPHSGLRMKSPREFRRQQIELQRRAQNEKSALNCV